MLNVIAEEADALAFALRPIGTAVWLSENHAFDIPIEEDSDAILAQAQAAVKGACADINIVPAANRRKRLLVADMESTIVDCECLDEMADLAGLGPRIAEITARAMRGELAFDDALRERVALLKGLPVSLLERVYNERVRLNPGAKALVSTMRAHGAYTMLVSGGFSFFTERVAHATGFDAQQGNVLLHDGTVLTGVVREPILGRDAKLHALEGTAGGLGIDAADALAVGDGANDLAMVAHAGIGVAWHAKPVVADAAAARIDYADLTALLYLQGYKDEEIVR